MINSWFYYNKLRKVDRQRWVLKTQQLRSHDRSPYQSLKTIKEQGLSNFIRDFLSKSVTQTPVVERVTVLNQATQIANSNSEAGVSSAILALTSRTDTSLGLDKIDMPTLILQGEFDSIIPMASAKLLHEKIKGSDFFIIPNAGHLSNLENPDAFNERLVNFMAKFQTLK